MKSTVLYFLLLLSAATATAQRKSITDSLTKLLTAFKADTNRVLILVSLGQHYHRANPGIAMQYLHNALQLAQRIKYEKGEARSLLWKGIILQREGRNPEALEFLQIALKKSERVGDGISISSNLRYTGILYAGQGDYAKAMNYFFQAKKIQEELRAVSPLANTLSAIGEIHMQNNRVDSALLYFNEAYQLIKDKNDVALDDKLKSLGQLHFKMADDTKAMDYFRRSIPIAITDNDQSTLNEAYLGVAQLFLKRGQADSSIFYSKKALALAQSVSFAKGVLAASQLLSNIYEASNEHEAFYYYKIATAAKDSLFNAEKAKQVQNLSFLEHQRLQSIEANRLEYKNRVKVYALLSALGVFLLLALILWRNNRSKQKAKVKIEKAYEELKTTQAQLIQREKMASLGELTAGIAHEIQNPLNFVNNFSEVSLEILDDAQHEMDAGNTEEAKSIVNEAKENLKKVVSHGKRADAIVKGMLEHSRSTKGEKQTTDINALVDEYMRLAYHGFRAKDKGFNIDLVTHYDPEAGQLNVVPQDIGRVLLNLFNNAFYAVQQKKVQMNGTYEPEVTVSTKKANDKVEIHVKDNGAGIPEKIIDKIYQPFFTTKPTGQGTGLGLSLSYDIIKAHGGEIKVETEEGQYTEFTLFLPVSV